MQPRGSVMRWRSVWDWPMPDIEIGYLAMHLERMLDSETE